MVEDKQYALLFYKYGEFVAKVMLAGIIHPDMQRSNIGIDSTGECKFCDYAEAEKIDMPKELNEDRVRQMTEALFPLIDGTEKSFLNCSYFRMGFVANGGILAKELFANATNNGFSSSLYVKPPVIKKNYDASALCNTLHNVISEWQKVDIKSLGLEKYKTLDEYNHSAERNGISFENRYFLDMLYLTNACLVFKDRTEFKVPYANALFNMALLAMIYNKPYTEYGLLKKCLKTHSGVHQIEEMCKGRVFSLMASWECNSECIDFIDEVIDKYDLFEILWILDDVDIFNK